MRKNVLSEIKKFVINKNDVDEEEEEVEKHSSNARI